MSMQNAKKNNFQEFTLDLKIHDVGLVFLENKEGWDTQRERESASNWEVYLHSN